MRDGERRVAKVSSGREIQAEYRDYDNGDKGGWVFELRDGDVSRLITVAITHEAKCMAEARGFVNGKDGIDEMVWTFLVKRIESGELLLDDKWNPSDRRRLEITMHVIHDCRPRRN